MHTRCTDRQQYDGNTPITSCLVHIQLLYGILYTTTSRPNTNTSPITLYVSSRASSHFGQHVIYLTLKQIQKNRWPDIISRTYIYAHDKQKYSDPISTTSGETMNKYETGNYNYCIKNTTAVWNLTRIGSVGYPRIYTGGSYCLQLPHRRLL